MTEAGHATAAQGKHSEEDRRSQRANGGRNASLLFPSEAGDLAQNEDHGVRVMITINVLMQCLVLLPSLCCVVFT